ncbi:MAG: 5-(carboxyamino)imidazole ribonucleotide mutase, partial [Crocinitomicaceae bacterium]
VALNGAKNAGILAAKIIGSSNPEVLTRMEGYMEELKQKVLAGAESVKKG